MMLARQAGHLRRATPGARAVCPFCDEPVMAKCGEIVVWHWSHFADHCSDSWAEESDWHLAWKEWALRLGWNVEVTFEKDGKRHRADIVTPSGIVIELQHSALDVRQIAARERFYDRMVWIWDVTACTRRFKFSAPDGHTARFRWRRPRWSLCEITKPLFLDFGNGGILQTSLWRMQSHFGDYEVCLGRGTWRNADLFFPTQFKAPKQAEGQTRLAI